MAGRKRKIPMDFRPIKWARLTSSDSDMDSDSTTEFMPVSVTTLGTKKTNESPHESPSEDMPNDASQEETQDTNGETVLPVEDNPDPDHDPDHDHEDSISTNMEIDEDDVSAGTSDELISPEMVFTLVL